MNLTTDELAYALGRLCAGQRIDVTLTAVSETLAHIVLANGCDPEEAITIVSDFTRRWLASGLLEWRRAPTPTRVH